MKKFIFIMPLMAISLLASCGNGGDAPEPEPTGTISIAKSFNNCTDNNTLPATIDKSDEFTPEYTIKPLNGYVLNKQTLSFNYENSTATTNDYTFKINKDLSLLTLSFIPKDNVIITMSGIVNQEPYVRVNPACADLARISYPEELVKGKDIKAYINLNKDDSDVFLMDEIAVKANGVYLKNNQDFEVVDIGMPDRYELHIKGDFAYGLIEVSEINVITESSYQDWLTVSADKNSPIPLTVTPGYLAYPPDGYHGLIKVEGGLDIEPEDIILLKGGKPGTHSEYSALISKIYDTDGFTDCFDIQIGFGDQTHEDISIQAKPKISNYKVNRETFKKATLFTDPSLKSLHVYSSTKTNNAQCYDLTIEDYADDLYYSASKFDDELDTYREIYNFKDNGINKESWRESTTGEWLEDNIEEVNTLDKNIFAQAMQQMLDYRLYVVGAIGSDFYDILTPPTDDNPYYYCEDIVGDIADEHKEYKNIYTNLKFQFNENRLVSASFDENEEVNNTIAHHKFLFDYDERTIVPERGAEFTHIVDETGWKAEMNMDYNSLNIKGVQFVFDFTGSTLPHPYNEFIYKKKVIDASGPKICDYYAAKNTDEQLYTYFENKNGAYYRYEPDSNGIYCRNTINQTDYDENSFNRIIYEYLFLNFHDKFNNFEEVDGVYKYSDDEVYFNNGKLVSVIHNVPDNKFSLNINRYNTPHMIIPSFVATY